MALKTNFILPLASAVAVIMLGVVGFSIFLGSKNNSSSVESANGRAVVAPIRVDGDSSSDTLNSLQATTARVLRDSEDAKAKNVLAQEKMEAMELERLAEIETLKADFAKEVEQSEAAQQEIKALMKEEMAELSNFFQREMALITERAGNRSDIVNGGAEGTIPYAPLYTPGQKIEATAVYDVVFIESIDQLALRTAGGAGEPGSTGVVSAVTGNLSTGRLLDGGGSGSQATVSSGGFDPNVISSMVTSVDSSTSITDTGANDPAERSETERFYTIPDLSVLANSTTVTALMGKVYRDEQIVDPVPIKILVGRDNLTANLKELPPEVEHILFGGFAVGDPTFACVEGNLTSATFVFYDGTVKSAYIGDEGSRPSNSAYPGDRIGFISDSWGNPCIPGTYVTDALKQLSILAALDGVAGYSSALRQEEVETSVFSGANGGGQAVESLTGSAGRFAVATGVSSGLNNASEFARENFEKIFEGYYVPAGVNVSVHIEQELRIDKEFDARQIRYGQRRSSVSRLD